MNTDSIKTRFSLWLSIHCNELKHGDYEFLERAPGETMERLNDLLQLLFQRDIGTFMQEALVNGFCNRDLLIGYVEETTESAIEQAKERYLELNEEEREFADRFFSRFLNRTPWNFFQFGLAA